MLHCENCKKVFKYPSQLKHHSGLKKKCESINLDGSYDEGIEKKENNTEEANTNQNIELNKLKKDNARLVKENQRLFMENEQLLIELENKETVTNTVNNTNNINITIFGHNKKIFSHIDVQELLKAVSNTPDLDEITTNCLNNVVKCLGDVEGVGCLQ
jgi:N12 class adenine-specific DNA methylase